jgi:hypothetical protein
MATNVKIRGIDRGKSAVSDGSVSALRGFRVKSSLGNSVTGGTSVKASLTIGATTNGAVYTAKIGGAAGNNIQVGVTQSGGTATVLSVVTTYAATTGYPSIVITAGSTCTPNTIVAAVNADPVASQFITAAPLTTGDGTTLAAAAASALTSGADGTGTAEAFYVKVTNKATVVVDVDEPKTARTLKRNGYRFVSLGAA